MLTIFSTPKPFRGHINIIQRNAIKSWSLVHPDVEVILFGNDEGAAEVCQEFGHIHVPKVITNAFGTKLIKGLFEDAQKIARHDLLCYVNCDILLPSTLIQALQLSQMSFDKFLLVGRRWETDVTEPWDFSQEDWESRLRSFALDHGSLAPAWSIDYFAFRRGLFENIPPLVIGRVWWDHWLIWKARSVGAPVIDASSIVMAVHQNHSYSYHVKGEAGVRSDRQAHDNYEHAGGKSGYIRSMMLHIP